MSRFPFDFRQSEGPAVGNVAEFATPFMSHQTSQQTVVTQRQIFTGSRSSLYIPTFDPNDDEMTDAVTHDIDRTQLAIHV